MTDTPKPTRVFGVAGDPATEALLAKFTQKGLTVSLADIKAEPKHLSEFLGRGFSAHPMAVRPDGHGWGGDAEMISTALDQLPDVAAPQPAAEPPAAPAASAEPSPAVPEVAPAPTPPQPDTPTPPQPEAATPAPAPEPAPAESGKVN